MVIKENSKARKYFLYEQNGQVEVFMSTSFRGARQGNKLTVRAGKTRLDLNGRQISALRRVLSEAENVVA